MKCSESNKNDEFIDFKLSRGDDGRAQCNKKPREDEVSICRDCAVEMWTKEKEA